MNVTTGTVQEEIQLAQTVDHVTFTNVNEQILPMFMCHILSFSNDFKHFVNSNASSFIYLHIYTLILENKI